MGDCQCGKGVFVCWDDIGAYVMLLVSVLYSVVVGMLLQQFSSVARAVTDAFSLLLIYFVGDPWINGTNLNDKTLNMTAFILPLSSQILSEAASELKKVQDASEKESNESKASIDFARKFAEDSDDEADDG